MLQDENISGDQSSPEYDALDDMSVDVDGTYQLENANIKPRHFS